MERISHAKETWGAGIVGSKVIITNLLYKWFVKVIELGESNIQLVLRYMLAWAQPTKKEKLGVCARPVH